MGVLLPMLIVLGLFVYDPTGKTAKRLFFPSKLHKKWRRPSEEGHGAQVDGEWSWRQHARNSVLSDTLATVGDIGSTAEAARENEAERASQRTNALGMGTHHGTMPPMMSVAIIPGEHELTCDTV